MLFIHYFNSRISRIGPSNGAPAGIFRFGSLRKAENVLLFQEKLAWNFEIRVISSWLWSALPRRTICLSVRSSRSEGRKSGIRRQSSPFSNTGSQWIKAPLRSAFISPQPERSAKIRRSSRLVGRSDGSPWAGKHGEEQIPSALFHPEGGFCIASLFKNRLFHHHPHRG